VDERKILALFYRRSADAVIEVQKAYGSLLRQLCGNILEDARDTEECINDTLLALWNTIPPESPESLLAYTCRIGRNQALKRRRDSHAAKRDSRKSLPLEELLAVLPAPSLEEQWDADQLTRAIEGWLERQTKTDRVLFLRRFWFGDPIREASARVGLSEAAASKRLQRMKKRLRDYLEQEGYLDV